MANELSEEPRKFTAKEIIAWAWKHDVPDVPYEKSRDLSGPIYRALKKSGYISVAGIFTVSEKVVHDVLQECKHEAFVLIPGGMSRETEEKIHADYWKSVEQEWNDYFDDNLDDEDYFLSYPDRDNFD